MICKSCQKDKPKSEFYSYKKRGKVFHNNKCKLCVVALKSKRYREDLEYQKRLKEQSIKYAHSEHGRLKKREWQRKRTKTKKFKKYHYQWEHTTEKGKASLKRRRGKWVKTIGGQNYIKRKSAKRRSRIEIKADLTKEQWKKILEKYNYSCAYCGSKDHLGQDHIIPLIKGGHHTKDNIVPACRKCNSTKGDKIWKPKLS